MSTYQPVQKSHAGIVLAVVATVWASACSSERAIPVVISPVVVTEPVAAPTPVPTPAPPPTPAPVPTPDLCPTLTAWTSRLFNITDSLNRSATTPTVGGHVVIDSTPLFGGRECNAEHANNCGGRQCEDPEGGAWTLTEGTSPMSLQVDGYQIRIGPLNEGAHRWRVCPRSDARDAEGERLTIGTGDVCSEGEFSVQLR